MSTRSSSPAALPRAVALAIGALLLVTSLPAGATVHTAADPEATTATDAGTSGAAVEAARKDYEAALERVSMIGAQSARLSANAEAATATASELHAQATESGDGLWPAMTGLVSGESDLDRAAEAADNAAHARDLADLAATALEEAIAASEDARLRVEQELRRQHRAEASLSAREASDAAIARSRFRPTYDVSQRDQQRRDRGALDEWHDYLDRLGRAGVVPPSARRLADPSRLTGPLEPVRDARGKTVKGVGQLDRPGAQALSVLPAETVRAVSEAFNRVGRTGVPGGTDPRAYACGGFLAQVWGPAGLTLPADAVGQWQELRDVPTATVQIGDVAVLGNPESGLDQTGVYVGRDRVIVADARTGQVGVREVRGDQLLGIRRVTLSRSGQGAAPPLGGTCGLSVSTTPEPTGAGPLLLPLGDYAYRPSAGFGDAGSLWSSGAHTGQDFGAAAGTPVLAAADGVVSVEHPSWAGNLVRVDHGGGVETWYAHLSAVSVEPGQTVAAGEPVGAVGSEGNSTGPHLHFEVWLDGSTVDPAAVLELPERPRPDYPNGQVPESSLCTAVPDGGQLLRCDAAVAFRLLSAGFAAEHGVELCLTDSYRSLAGQIDVFRRKPGLAATPGTSVHGWGLAIDMCGGVERFGTPEHEWMLAHGPEHGWVHPSWAGAAGSRPEPWHFEFATGTGPVD